MRSEVLPRLFWHFHHPSPPPAPPRSRVLAVSPGQPARAAHAQLPAGSATAHRTLRTCGCAARPTPRSRTGLRWPLGWSRGQHGQGSSLFGAGGLGPERRGGPAAHLGLPGPGVPQTVLRLRRGAHGPRQPAALRGGDHGAGAGARRGRAVRAPGAGPRAAHQPGRGAARLRERVQQRAGGRAPRPAGRPLVAALQPGAGPRVPGAPRRPLHRLRRGLPPARARAGPAPRALPPHAGRRGPGRRGDAVGREAGPHQRQDAQDQVQGHPGGRRAARAPARGRPGAARGGAGGPSSRPALPLPAPGPAPGRPAPRAHPSPPAAGPPRAPTEPRYSVVQRHHVDLQDYRCARDSAPGPVPHELVVTIELPLLRSAEQVALEVTGRLLCLDSRAPDYRLRLSLPYPVDDNRGTAQFHRARRQLLLTLPVVRPAPRPAAPEEPARAPGTDGPGPEEREREEEEAPEEEEEEEEGGRERKDREEGELERREKERGEEKQREEEEEREQRAEERQRQEEREHREEEEPEEKQRGERRGEEEQREKEEPERREEEQPEEEQRGERRGEEEQREQQWEERGPGGRAVWTAAVGEEPPLGAGSLPGTSAGSPGRGPGAGARGARGEPRGEAMGGPGAARREPVCPPSRCRQDEESLTLLVQVPRIQPQSLQGDLSPVGYQLRFSTQDLGSYAFSLGFAPENQLSCRAPAVSVSPHNAVIELAKAPGCRGPWREWYYGPHGGSLEERLFVNEENVNEVLEEVLSSPSTWTEPLTPPLIEVLQVSDSKIQIHAKLQECSNSEQLHENEETVNEGSHLTEKESTEHSTSFPSESADSSGAVQVLETASCGSAAHLQQESLDISKMPLGKSEQSESKMEPEFIKEKRAVYSNEEKDNLKEPVTTEEELLDDHLSSLLNKTTVHNGSGFDNIKETNMQDGSVQIIKDHVTHCAFSFQNSLLYDLD
uniref:PIH1D1/2/3 CS-like domain-containing protein n=1 Tax=Equus asinus TaxID=9793 RepID=A0A9L0ITR0_EQUAS